jgi:hypothetical protein
MQAETKFPITFAIGDDGGMYLYDDGSARFAVAYANVPNVALFENVKRCDCPDGGHLNGDLFGFTDSLQAAMDWIIGIEVPETGPAVAPPSCGLPN